LVRPEKRTLFFVADRIYSDAHNLLDIGAAVSIGNQPSAGAERPFSSGKIRPIGRAVFVAAQLWPSLYNQSAAA